MSCACTRRSPKMIAYIIVVLMIKCRNVLKTARMKRYWCTGSFWYNLRKISYLFPSNWIELVIVTSLIVDTTHRRDPDVLARIHVHLHYLRPRDFCGWSVWSTRRIWSTICWPYFVDLVETFVLQNPFSIVQFLCERHVQRAYSMCLKNDFWWYNQLLFRAVLIFHKRLLKMK